MSYFLASAVRSARGLFAQILFACALLIAPCSQVAAGELTTAPNLRGLTEATLGISQITAEGRQCGLDPDRLGEPARPLLADAGLMVRDNVQDRIVISAVSARAAGEQCATAVLMGIYSRETFFSARNGWLETGYVVLWQRSLIIATPMAQHPAAVADAVRRLTEQVVDAWREQNRQGTGVTASGTALPQEPSPRPAEARKQAH